MVLDTTNNICFLAIMVLKRWGEATRGTHGNVGERDIEFDKSAAAIGRGKPPLLQLDNVRHAAAAEAHTLLSPPDNDSIHSTGVDPHPPSNCGRSQTPRDPWRRQRDLSLPVAEPRKHGMGREERKVIARGTTLRGGVEPAAEMQEMDV